MGETPYVIMGVNTRMVAGSVSTVSRPVIMGVNTRMLVVTKFIAKQRVRSCTHYPSALIDQPSFCDVQSLAFVVSYPCVYIYIYIYV